MGISFPFAETLMSLRVNSKNISFGFHILLALAFGISASAPIWAQVTGATLSGTVSDMSGAMVPQAQLSIKNISTDITRAVTSDASGFYTMPNLLPGSYEVTASAR